jgi:hypothetical protein
MVRRLWTALLLGAIAAAARAGEKGEVPKGPPPGLLLASVNKKGQLVMLEARVEYTKEVRSRVVTRDGKRITVQEQVTIPKVRHRERVWPTAGIRVFDVAWNKVDPKSLRKRLARRTLVLISIDGKPVDPAYLTAFKKDTLVLVLPLVADPPPEPEKD